MTRDLAEDVKADAPAFPATFENIDLRSGSPGLTKREYAAIKLCVPSSGSAWLDEMIQAAQRRRYAAACIGAIQIGYVVLECYNRCEGGTGLDTITMRADMADRLADAMMTASDPIVDRQFEAIKEAFTAMEDKGIDAQALLDAFGVDRYEVDGSEDQDNNQDSSDCN